MPSLHPDPLESFRIGWPVPRDDGLDDLARFMAEPGFGSRFRLPGGQFALCQRDERTGVVAALRDPTATMPLHAHYDGRRWLVSTSVRSIERVVARRFDLRLDVLRNFHQTSRLPPGQSIFHDVQLLSPGAVCLLHPDGRLETASVPIEWPAADSEILRFTPSECVEAALPILCRSVSDAIGSEPAIVQQSGGLDSNLLLHAAIRLNLPVHAHGLVFPGMDCDESRPMRLSCKAAGVAYDPVEYDGRDYQARKDELFELSEYVPFTTNFMALDMGRRARQQGFDRMLNGMGGDEIFFAGCAAAVSFLARFAGIRAVRSIPLDLQWLFLRGLARRRVSGREPSLFPSLISGSWQFQMSAVQMLMSEGIELRLPYRDWRAIVGLRLLVAAFQRDPSQPDRELQRELLDRLVPGLWREAGIGKVHFNAIGSAPGEVDPILGTSRFERFSALVPDYLSFARAQRIVR